MTERATKRAADRWGGRRSQVALLLAFALALWPQTIYRAGPNERTDLPVYLAAANDLLAGEEPFGATSDRGWSYYYPPTLAVLVTPLTPFAQRVAAALWFAVTSAVLAWGVWAWRRAVGRPPLLDRWDVLAFALVFFPVCSGQLRGQVGALLLGLAGLAYLALQRRREVAAGVLVSLAAAIKITPGLLVAGLLLGRRWRALAATGAGLVVWLLLLPAPFVGLDGAWASNATVARVMVLGPLASPEGIDMPEDEDRDAAPADAERDAGEGAAEATADAEPIDPHIPNNQSLASQVIKRSSGWTERALLAALAIGLLAVCLPPSARGPDPPSPEAWSLLLAVPLLVAPIAWHHHHVLLYPALLAVVGRARREPEAPLGVLAAFAGLSLLHFAVKPLRPYGLLGWGTLAVVGTVAAAAWREEPGRRGPVEEPEDG